MIILIYILNYFSIIFELLFNYSVMGYSLIAVMLKCSIIGFCNPHLEDISYLFYPFQIFLKKSVMYNSYFHFLIFQLFIICSIALDRAFVTIIHTSFLMIWFVLWIWYIVQHNYFIIIIFIFLHFKFHFKIMLSFYLLLLNIYNFNPYFTQFV